MVFITVGRGFPFCTCSVISPLSLTYVLTFRTVIWVRKGRKWSYILRAGKILLYYLLAARSYWLEYPLASSKPIDRRAVVDQSTHLMELPALIARGPYSARGRGIDRYTRWAEIYYSTFSQKRMNSFLSSTESTNGTIFEEERGQYQEGKLFR